MSVIQLTSQFASFTAPLLNQHGPEEVVTSAAGVAEVATLNPMLSWVATLIPLMPLLSAVACAYFALGSKKYNPKQSRLPGWICAGSIFTAFMCSVILLITGGHDAVGTTLFSWIHSGGLDADVAFFIDPLTLIMLMVVTGISTLVAIYASEYMAGDEGYARFFAFVSLFVVAMTLLVLSDNLVLLYLGWEGVGVCSYLLIGFYYKKPSAVAAAKKAFIVNRIGDLGFALGIMLTYLEFGTVQYTELFRALADQDSASVSMSVQVIPFLLMLGAFGKSAQLPLYVWLPDAMEGPTPVSALIHAATMVTAGVYLIARLMPIFVLSPYALPTVAWVGGLTALFAATIGMAQYDMKRIFAYSTVSQLGYMFLGLGILASTGAVFHLFTHAFFKALLFLGSGAVMHGFAGQLDIRKLSGLRKTPGWTVVTWTMLIGCLALAGFPFFSGFFSKDMILAGAFDKTGPGFATLGVIGLFTAFLTAYYTFRVFFRVFMGPEHYEAGDELHDDGDSHGHFHPHAPGPAVNFVLIVLAFGALFAGILGLFGEHHGWLGGMVHSSSANPMTEPATIVMNEAHGDGFFSDPHQWMYLASTLAGLFGIAVAWYLHYANRAAADRLKANPLIQPLGRLMENKWCVDEGYDLLIRKPLRILGYICYGIGDTLIINGLVNLGGFIPRTVGRILRPMQNGILQQYGLGMATGLAVLLVLIFWLV